MLRKLALLYSCLCLSSTLPAQSETTELPPEVQRFRALILEAGTLNAQQRFSEALQRLAEAEDLKQDEALVHNLRGSVYTGLRDYPKARESFEKAHKLVPASFEPRFNLVELDFVEGKFAEAEKGFTAILKDFPKLPLQPRHLATFKLVVSQLKQDKVEDAAKTSKAFTFMDDTPAYYYSQAAFSFQKKDALAAQEWLEKGAAIFQKREILPYLDSLMESRWINSIAIPNRPAPALAP